MNTMIPKIIIVALILFFAFRIVFLIKNRAPISAKLQAHLSYVLPITEMFVWIALLIWTFRMIYITQNYFILIALVLVLLVLVMLTYTMLSDFVSGNILKMQNKVREGAFIEVDELKGRIRKVGLLRLDIEDKRGNISSIPYSNIRSKTILQSGSNQNLVKVVLRFAFPDTMKVNYITPILKRQLLNTPWVAVSQAPSIENTSIENGRLWIEVGVYTLDKTYGENIKNSVDKLWAEEK